MGLLSAATSPLLLLLLLLSSPQARAAAVIPLGSSLTPSSLTPWSSPSNTFTLSFIPSPQHPSLFLAAITYSGGVPIWNAGGAAASVDSSAALRLLPSGNLRLTNGSGSLVWESATPNLNVSAAALLESGNLELNSPSSVVWQSFDHPVDTIVVTQNFSSNQTLLSGLYSFSLIPSSANLTLLWNNTVTYYNNGALNASISANKSFNDPVLSLHSDGILYLSDPALPSPATVAYSSDYGETATVLRFVRLDSDGNLRAYSAPLGTGVSNGRWAAVDDQCQVFGYCGNMGVCSYNDTAPVCGCPSENFMPSDPNDARQGCRPTTQIKDCPGKSTMLAMNHTEFLTYPPDISNERFFVGITACQQNCLSGGSCVASTSLADGSGQCYIKISNFVSGYQSAALQSTSFVKVCSPGLPNQPPPSPSQSSTRSKLRGWVIAIVIIGTIAGLAILELGSWWFFCRNSPKFGYSSAQYALLEYASGAPVQFSYKELQRSTKGFKDKLGAGGFGAVYKGVLLANRTVVAVKQLEGIEQGEKQFRMEVATISSTHHLNLVRLIGFCSEGRHRLLVYEFMKNGSLDSFLFSGESSGKFSWAARFNVAIGTARGITYLHEECRDCIVHCDIKPENILLDENYNAKVSDFGLAKLVNSKDHRHRTLTGIRGTRGYLAPEWLANLPITSKSDVYSYGMVLLETVSGRRNFDVSEETNRKKFSIWAYEEFESGNIRSILDKRLGDQDVDMAQLWRSIQVSFWCIQEQPSQRPSMGKVVQMLEGIMEIERPPAPKAINSSQSVTSGSASVSGISGVVASTIVPSLFSSVQAVAGSPSFSKGNVERVSSSIKSIPFINT